MAIPLTYNLRNLVVRKTTTVMTALGIGLTVAVLLAMLALVGGLQTSLQSSGDPLQVLVLRKGSNSELCSLVTPANFQDLKFKRGIRATSSGQPLASLEMVTVINLASVDAPQGINVTVRGMTPAGIEMRDNLQARVRALVSSGTARSGGGRIDRQALSRRTDRPASAFRPRRLGRGRRHGGGKRRHQQRNLRRSEPG